MFQRTYTSDRQEDVGLGRGWSFTFNDFIAMNGDHATLTTADGNTLAFHRDKESNRFRLDVEQPTTHAQLEITDTETLTETNGDTTRTYARRGDAFHLARVQVGNLLGITINHNARGLVTRIANDTGGTLRLNWSNAANPRLLSVTDHANRQVAFQQTGKTLARVTDPAGAVWSYDYKDERLTRAVDPVKRILLRTRYDASGYVIETGDAVGTTRFDYEFAAPEVSRRTTVTDSLGAQTFYEHNERGALTVTSDDEGNSARIEYNAANRPVRISDSTGGAVKFEYDDNNQLLRQVNSDGTEKSFAPERNGAARNYSTTYNARGQLTLLKSAERELTFEYDANGNETAYTYSDVGRFEKTYDAAGFVTSERLPSGRRYTNKFDARGLIVKRSSNRGGVVTVERDASGLPVAFVKNGKRRSAERDEAGRIVEESDYDGAVRRYGYDARGALTRYADSTGRWDEYRYDRRGRLQTITDERGARQVERDARGGIRRIAAVVRRAGAVRLVKATYRATTVEDGMPYAPPQFPGGGWDKDIPVWESTLEPVDGGGGQCETKAACRERWAREIEEERVGCRKHQISIWVTAMGFTVNASMITAAATGAETLGVGAVISGLVGAIFVTGQAIILGLELRECENDAEDSRKRTDDLCGWKPESCP